MSSRNYKCPRSRTQASLLPPSIEEYIREGNHVRFIEEYVNSLSLLDLDFKNTEKNVTAGQPAYNPADLLKLYIYGYTNKLRSSRVLEREANRNLEVIWLLGDLRPSHMTIANFRKENGNALVKANRDFVLLCRELSLFGGKTIGIDGSYFNGNASNKSIVTKKKLEKQVESIEKNIEAWQAELEKNDLNEPQNISTITDDKEISEKMVALTNLLSIKKQQQIQLDKSGETQISQTDQDARLLRKNGKTVSGYNIQIGVDDKHKLIVASEVTNDGNDSHQLCPVALKAKETLGVEEITAISDAGYYESEQLKQCEDNGIKAYVAIPDTSKRFKEAGRFSRKSFIYNADKHCYTCPQGYELIATEKLVTMNNKQYYYFKSTKRQCSGCALSKQCLSDKGSFRQIYRWIDEEVLERHKKRMDANPGMMRIRSALVEHPFGTLKRRAGWDHFLVRGFTKVRGEWSIMALCYNLTRVSNLISLEKFKEYCQARKSVMV